MSRMSSLAHVPQGFKRNSAIPTVNFWMILLFGMSKRMASEETGWKPVCRDRRGRLSSQSLACQNGWQVKKQAGSPFAETGEDACLPKVWRVKMDGERRNRLEARLPRQAGTPVFPIFGMSKWVTGEDACLPE